MPGIKDLREIYEKKGAAEIENYLNGNITITEKIDAHRFSFEKNSEGSFSYFKKNDNRPLTSVDRTISDLYEKAIIHIESLPNYIKHNIPENHRFGFAYFPSDKPLRIEYKNVHSSRLVLTDVTLRGDNNKVKRVYEDISFVNRWSKSFGVGEMPVIFQGKLSESNKEIILNLINGDARNNAFFAEHIKSTFGRTYTKNHIIEGIVIKSENGLVQIKDPTFGIFETAYEQQESRDFYDLTLLQIESFIQNDFNMPQSFSSASADARYIDLVNQAFNAYVENNRVDESLDPSFLQPKIIGSHGQLSRKFIRNTKTVSYLNRSKIYEELYKVFLSSFRRKRKAHGLLTESFTDSFNVIVENIQYLTTYNPITEEEIFEADEDSTTTDKEAENKDSEETKSDSKDKEKETKPDSQDTTDADKNTDKEGKDEIINDEPLDYEKGVDLNSADNKIDTFKAIASIQIAFNHEKKEVKPAKTEVIVMLGDFNPINNDHLRHIEKFIEDGKKVVLCYKKKDICGQSQTKFNLTDDTIIKSLERFQLNYSSSVLGVVTIPFASISEIFKSCRSKDFEPITLLVERHHGPNYMAQLHLEDTILGNRIGANKDFEIKEFNNKVAYDVLRSIEDDNHKGFVNTTPQPTHNFWDNIMSEFNAWQTKN